MAHLTDPASWGRSNADAAVLESLVAEGLLPPNTDPSQPVWIALTAEERGPKPPSGYIVSLARLHERGFGIPAG